MTDGTVWQEENAHAQRLLEEPCHFCWQRTTQLWYDPARDEPYQVRCLTCEAAGPWCDCGDESAVPTWLRPYDLLDAKEETISALCALMREAERWIPKGVDGVRGKDINDLRVRIKAMLEHRP